MKQLLLVAAVALAPSVGLVQDFEKGLAAAQSGDFATALKEWRPLAERGYAKAQSNLAWMYEHGRGILQDEAEAVKWYRKAAEQGDARAQSNLGVMFKNDQVGAYEPFEAVKWFRKAAEQGNVDAYISLGAMYYDGEGVIRDNVFAYFWYDIAASRGNTDAQESRNVIANQMTPEDISIAQELAHECLKKNLKGC